MTSNQRQPPPVGTPARLRLERDIRGRAAQGESPTKIAHALGIHPSVVTAALSATGTAGTE